MNDKQLARYRILLFIVVVGFPLLALTCIVIFKLLLAQFAAGYGNVP